jgi:hypothetical protein
MGLYSSYLHAPVPLRSTVADVSEIRTSSNSTGKSRLILRLDKQAGAVHALGLLKAHEGEDGRRDITEHAIRLLQAPGLGGVSHDKRNLVKSVRCLGCSLLCEHLFGISSALSVYV